MSTRLSATARVQGRLHREEDAHLHKQGSQSSGAVPTSIHTSVMVAEVLNGLEVRASDVVLDATAGQGGHSFEILSQVPNATVVALDADPAAVDIASTRLAPFGDRAQVVESNFEHVDKALKKLGIREVNKVLFDLGWNSGQLASGRGLSFQHDEELNMSYGKKPASGFTAKEILNEWDEKTLADVFFGYGEEQYARRIAKAVIARRQFQPIHSTLELVELVRDAVPPAYRHGRINPATKTFQALRIAVNDELGVIERGLVAVWPHLACGGRIAVITFHSVEDRLVKQLFQQYAKKDGLIVTKKPIIPSRQEISNNPRARSAKLRLIEKVCNQ